MKALLLLRFNQVYRNIKSVGFVLAFIALLICTAIWIMGIQFLITLDWKAFGLVFLLICFSTHLARKDHDWLQIHMERPNLIKAMDYLLISIPFVILYGISGKWFNVLIIPLVAFLTGISPVQKLNHPTVFNKLIEQITPHRLFEIRAAYRQYSFYMILLFLSILLSPLHISLLAANLILWIMILFQAYQTVEHRTLIDYNRNFVYQKIIRAIRYISLSSLPIYTLTLSFSPELYYFVFIHWFAILLSSSFVISNKFALYHPDQIVQTNSAQHAIFLVFLFLPGLFIACVFWNITLYNKARRNLRYYYG